MGLLTALGPLAIDMYLPAFPAMASSLNTDLGSIERTLASYLLGLSCAQLIYGPVADRFGRKKPLLFGLALFTIASLGCALSTDIHHLTGWRILQAFGGAAGMVITRAVIRDNFDTRDAAKALSMLMLVMGVTPILAPILGAQLLRFSSWHASFIFMCLVGVALFIATWRSMRETLDPNNIIPLRLTVIAKNYYELSHHRRFLFYSLAAAFGSAGMFAYIAGSARVFISIYDVNPSYFGLLFGLNAASLIAASQFSARLLNRFTPDRLLRWAQSSQLFFIATALLLTVTQQLGLISLMICLMGFMACQGFIGPNSAALALGEQGHRLGAASALMGTIQMLCGALAGLAVSAWHSATPLPLTAVLAGCATLSWLASRTAETKSR